MRSPLQMPRLLTLSLDLACRASCRHERAVYLCALMFIEDFIQSLLRLKFIQSLFKPTFLLSDNVHLLSWG